MKYWIMYSTLYGRIMKQYITLCQTHNYVLIKCMHIELVPNKQKIF